MGTRNERLFSGHESTHGQHMRVRVCHGARCKTGSLHRNCRVQVHLMPNREANVTKRIQTEKGMRYCPVVLAANVRIKPDHVLVNGQPERHPEGAYYLEWREREKRVRISVGKNAADAQTQRFRKQAELNAVNNGVAVISVGQGSDVSLAAAISEYLDEIKLTKKPIVLLLRIHCLRTVS